MGKDAGERGRERRGKGRERRRRREGWREGGREGERNGEEKINPGQTDKGDTKGIIKSLEKEYLKIMLHYLPPDIVH